MLAAFLNKPYPYFKNREKDLLSYVFIGIFVGIFLSIFQPFEISAWVTPYKSLKLFGFGLISFVVPGLLNLLIPQVIPAKTTEDKWVVYKEILLILTVLLFIAAGNLFYGRLLGIMPLSVNAYVMVFAFTLAVGIFPVSIHVVLRHNQLLKFTLQQTEALNLQLQQQHQPADTAKHFENDLQPAAEILPAALQFIAENEKDTFRISADQLLYIESADNYSNIVFTEAGKCKKHLFRSSLKRIEGRLADPAIIRCHRAYIVNLKNIIKIEGNAAGYKVFFNAAADVAYVSRNYIAVFNETLKSLK